MNINEKDNYKISHILKENHKNIIIVILVFLIILFYYKSYQKEVKICLCVLAKNENLYVREFVEHYQKLGYNNIYIYDNNDKNGENFEEVINDYIQNGFVKIIDFRERDKSSKPIFDAYKDCYSENKNLYDWLSFFDMDEFLELNKKYKKIQDFLNDKIFNKCQNIKINWLMYKNNNNIYYENKPLQQRIKTFNNNDSANRHIKSTVKGNILINYWENSWNPHTSNLKIMSCSSSGKVVKFDSPFNYPPDYTNAILKHYYYKSFEEYCIKIKRGKADLVKNNSNEFVNSKYYQLLNENKNNFEKLNILNKVFNSTTYKLK